MTSLSHHIEVYDMRFHVCYLPESFYRIILVLSHVMIRYENLVEQVFIHYQMHKFGRNAKFDKSYWILKTSAINGC